MARFDVYPNPGSHAKTSPYLLDVQCDLLDGLDTRMVIPLGTLDDYANTKLSSHLTPVLRIKGRDYVLQTPKMGAVPTRILKKPVASLASEQAGITGALDFLFQGY